ncbi:AI-2E family transporter [Methylobacterium oryzihabitans]|uniref:AI-2E family transporter n=1 Tax=Methylobacterium oryzihabitans TaxID=2499852 RepID=A0A3S2XHY4_9HYPH|nr:AI-2E family transporter [Methylobacterium oryzihabitans]RVU15288.1 AI-2E family transporter [Methylobacterium oryzihabitans]
MQERAQTGEGPTRPGDRTGTGARPLLLAGIGVVCFVVLLALVWHASDTLLLIFAGLLFAVFLDGLTHYLGRVVPLGHGVRLAIVTVLLSALFLGLLGLGGATLSQQAGSLGRTLQQQAGEVSTWLKQRGIDLPLPQSDRDGGKSDGGKSEGGKSGDGRTSSPLGGELPSPGSLLSDAGSVLGRASTIVFGVFGAIGNVFVVIVLGVFVAADPRSYRDGLLRFVPPRHRARAATVADDLGTTLRHWLFGQLVIMAAIFVCVWLGLSLLGLDGALILGLQAGLLCFIPTVGALVAGLVIVLASLASGLKGVIGAVAVYLLVQALESYVLTPFVQKKAIDIPPATIFAGQILLGVLFGLWGIALALPIMAVAKVLLDRLYVEDTLGESAEA